MAAAPLLAHAQTSVGSKDVGSSGSATSAISSLPDRFFKAEVNAVIKEQTTTIDGREIKQQDLRLKGLEGDMKDKIFFFNGIGDYDSVSKNFYKKGDKVIALESSDSDGNKQYFITDYVRTGSLWWLAVIFAAVLVLVGRGRGARSLLSLVLTFLVIVFFIIPKILVGLNPVGITIIGSMFILVCVIYLTEGWNVESHLAVASMAISLMITAFLSLLFVSWSKLSGMSSEESAFMVTVGQNAINFQGLLLAGIILGALGVLDDVVISQITSVYELDKANPSQSRLSLFRAAYNIGLSHINSMTNTLFLAYAGASLPLLILFVSGQSAFSGWSTVVNNENIAEEIVRTLTGSIGLILAVPISTILAVWWKKRRTI